MLELKHISKQFQEKKIIDDLSITFYDTGFIGIQGESGCGKSTLLYIIGMLDQNFDGEILYNGELVMNHTLFIKKHISYMMQNKDYIESLTVKENIKLSCMIGEKKYTESQFTKIVRQLGMNDYLNRYPRELSGGQLKRMSIAKALLKQSKIILCDEPTGALYMSQSHEVMKLLKNMSQTTLVIIVSHDSDLLKEYCDHVLTLKDGKLKGRMKKRKLVDVKEYSKKKVPLWFYPMKQCLHQKYKLIVLFIFQWILIVAFFVIVTSLFGVFDAIKTSEKQAVDKNIISVERKDGLPFIDSISNSMILETHSHYLLEQFSLTYSSKEILSSLAFMPHDISHIELCEGRFPLTSNEVIITSSLYKEFQEKTIDITYGEYVKQLNVVGVIQDDLFDTKMIYLSPLLRDEFIFIKDDYTLVIEAKDNQARELYHDLQKSYFVYSEVIERIDNYQSLLKLAKVVAIVFIGISFLVSLLLIGIVESIIYLERKHDTAYLLSLGLSKYRFIGLTMSEALIIGLIMASGGVLLSSCLYYYVNEVKCIKDFLFFELRLHPLFYSTYDLYFVMVLCYVMMAIIGVFVPMKKMMKVDMIDVLREE